ncbi:MAG: phosphoribosylformylglycinamidine synthase subunit PurS [candidate division FCPU426 bacterium]
MPATRKAWKVDVLVTLKPSVLDPQGATVQRALESMGYADLTAARLGKYLQLTFRGRLSRKAVEQQARRMCDKLLVNPVIEQYRLTVAEDRGREAKP